MRKYTINYHYTDKYDARGDYNGSYEVVAEDKESAISQFRIDHTDESYTIEWVESE